MTDYIVVDIVAEADTPDEEQDVLDSYSQQGLEFVQVRIVKVLVEDAFVINGIEQTYRRYYFKRS